MFGVSGKLEVGLVAEKKKVLIIKEDEGVKPCSLDRDHLSKKYSKLCFSSFNPCVALASSSSGTIQILDTTNGKLLYRFELKDDENSGGGCAGLGFGYSNKFYAAKMNNGEIYEWNLETEELTSSFKTDEEGEGITCFTCSTDEEEEPLLATGRTSISVWRKKKRICKYAGHSTNITSLAFLKGGALLSANDQDQYISIWPANIKKARNPIMILTCSEPPGRYISCGPRLLEGDEASVLAHSGKTIFIWRIPSMSEGDQTPPRSSNCTITAEEGTILGCDFLKNGKILCMSRVSDDLTPVLKTVEITSATREGGLIQSFKLNSKQQNDVQQNNEKETKGTGTVKRLDRTSTLLEHSEATSSANTKRARTISTNSFEDERPLITRLAEFSNRLDQQQTPSVQTKVATAAPTSLSVALEQALQTEDKEKIEAVLQTPDPEVISQTVQRLPQAKVGMLIRELAIRLQGKPGRAANLLIWITAFMDHHAPLLASDPLAREALKSIYAVVDTRVQMFDRLLRLKGRLDLILARSHSSNGNSGGPLLMFDAINARTKDDE